MDDPRLTTTDGPIRQCSYNLFTRRERDLVQQFGRLRAYHNIYYWIGNIRLERIQAGGNRAGGYPCIYYTHSSLVKASNSDSIPAGSEWTSDSRRPDVHSKIGGIPTLSCSVICPLIMGCNACNSWSITHPRRINHRYLNSPAHWFIDLLIYIILWLRSHADNRCIDDERQGGSKPSQSVAFVCVPLPSRTLQVH